MNQSLKKLKPSSMFSRTRCYLGETVIWLNIPFSKMRWQASKKLLVISTIDASAGNGVLLACSWRALIMYRGYQGLTKKEYD